MDNNHNHAGVKWVGEREGGEICWGDGVKLGCPPPQLCHWINNSITCATAGKFPD